MRKSSRLWSFAPRTPSLPGRHTFLFQPSRPLTTQNSITADENAKPEIPQCARCGRTEAETGTPLKRCAKCQTTYYCSRKCRKADRKTHEKVCAENAASGSASSTSNKNNTGSSFSKSSGVTVPPKGLSVVVDKPFHRLDAKTWLHDRPEGDVYKLLIDVYRMKMEDNYVFEAHVDEDSIYGGARDGRQGFERFLRLVEKQRGLLPSWWSKEKAEKCVAVGMKRDQWSYLGYAIQKDDVIEHYGDRKMPMQLRMFAEQVYGCGPGGQDGTEMRKLQMMIENGELTPIRFDLSSLFSRR